MFSPHEIFNKSTNFIAIFFTISGTAYGLKENDNFLHFTIYSAMAYILLLTFSIIYRYIFNTSQYISEKSITTISILDNTGSVVDITKEDDFKIIKGNVHEINQNFRSDGDIENIEVNKGIIKSNRSLDGYSLNHQLDRTYKKGDKFHRILKMKYVNSFLNEEEYWSAKITHPVIGRRIVIYFPIDRSPKTFYINKITKNKTEVLSDGSEIDTYMEETPDNRKRVVVSLPKALKMNDVEYKLHWQW